MAKKIQTQPVKRYDWRADFDNRVSDFVAATHTAMMRDMAFRRVYFYYTPTSGDSWGILHAIPEGDTAPSGAELVTAEHIPAGTKPQIAAWLQRYTGRLSLIPTRL